LQVSAARGSSPHKLAAGLELLENIWGKLKIERLFSVTHSSLYGSGFSALGGAGLQPPRGDRALAHRLLPCPTSSDPSGQRLLMTPQSTATSTWTTALFLAPSEAEGGLGHSFPSLCRSQTQQAPLPVFWAGWPAGRPAQIWSFSSQLHSGPSNMHKRRFLKKRYTRRCENPNPVR